MPIIKPRSRPRRIGPSRAQRSPSGQAITSTGYLVGSPVLSGILVTPQTALNFSSVFSAVNVIATDLASLSYRPHRRTGPNAQVEAPDVPSGRLFALKPNEETNAFRFRQSLMGHVLLWGNGYAEIVRDGRGRPDELWLLNPATTQPKRDKAGKLFYLLTESNKRLLPENVLHVAGLGFDGLVGYSCIHMAKQAVGLGIAAEEFGASFFGNGATPHGVLKTPKRLTSTARQNLRESVYVIHQGSKNAHHLAILEEGMDWQSMTMPLEDAQFLATRQFQKLEIAQIYRLPPHKLGDYSQSHLANIEESNRNYVDTTLLGWALAWESECDDKLLFESEREDGVFWHHNFFKLERGNTSTRIAFYAGMRNLGAMSADDIRASEGMNPIGAKQGGDLYLVQAQYRPLASAGKDPDPLPKKHDPPAGDAKSDDSSGGTDAG